MGQRTARAVKAAEPFDYASQWSAPKAEEITLPSGAKVLLGPPNLPQLARKGLIPNHLLPIVEKFIFQQEIDILKQASDKTPGEAPGAALLRFAELEDYFSAFAVSVAVDPVLSFDGKEGTVCVDLLSYGDKYAIWEWGAGVTQTLAEFRRNKARAAVDVEPLPDVNEGGEDPSGVAASDAA